MKGSFLIDQREGLWYWSIEAGALRVSGGSYQTQAAAALGMLYQLSLALLEQFTVGRKA